MDINAFLNELDGLFAAGKAQEVEGFLIKGIADASAEGDARASLTILNELIGYYRSAERHTEAVQISDQALALCQAMGLQGTAPYATTLLNAATAYRAAGRVLEAIEFYEEVEQIYQENLRPDDYRFASLYNNVSLAYQGLKQYEAALGKLEQALAIIKRIPDADNEIATTYTNMAMNSHLLGNEERAQEYLDMAEAVFKEGNLLDPHYGAMLILRAQIAFEQGEFARSAEVYEHALTIIDACFGHNETWKTVAETCASAWEAAGEPEKAAALRQDK